MRSFRREVFARAFLNVDTRASLIKSQCKEREERSECRTRASAHQIHEFGRRARKSKISKLTVAQHHFSAFQNSADDLLCVLSWMSSRSCGRFRGGRSRAGKNWQIPSVTGLD